MHASAGAVRDHIGRWGSVEDMGEGRCRLRMTTDSLDWPAMALGSVGVDFEVVSPPELVESVRDWAQRFSPRRRLERKRLVMCLGEP